MIYFYQQKGYLLIIMFFIILQEASTGVHEVFLYQFLMGFIQVVLLRDRGLWIRTVPYLWIASLEANV